MCLNNNKCYTCYFLSDTYVKPFFFNLFSDSSFWIQHTNIQHSDKYKRQLYMCWTEYINQTTKTTHTWRNVDCTTEFEYLCTLGTGYNIDN